MADRIGILSEGGLVQVGTPGEIYERPNCRFSAGFIGETNLFHGRIEGDRLASSDFPQPIVFAAGAGASPPSGGEAWLSLRPSACACIVAPPVMRAWRNILERTSRPPRSPRSPISVVAPSTTCACPVAAR